MVFAKFKQISLRGLGDFIGGYVAWEPVNAEASHKHL